MYSVKDKDLELIVQKAMNSTQRVKIASHRVESFSKNRHGIMGNHYALSVKVEVGTNGDTTCCTLRFFVKTPPESTTVRDAIVDECISLEEVYFFKNVYPTLMKNYKGIKWCAECYLSKPQLLVFEDLRSAGFSIRRDGIFDEQSLKSVLSTLARFHASSINAETAIGRPLNQVYRRAFGEKIFTENGKSGRSNKLAFHTMRLLADKFNLDGSLLPSILSRLYQLVQPVPGGCNVICHGDLWRSNIMFQDTNASPECIIVDYQMLRYASPSTDLAVLLYVHASSEFRASSELQMLRHYYSVFRETLVSCTAGVDDNHQRIPTHDVFLQDYYKYRLLGMACACMRWPKIVFERIMNDPLALENWYFKNRIDIYEKAIEQDSNYARIMRNCLFELLEEGKRTLNV